MRPQAVTKQAQTDQFSDVYFYGSNTVVTMRQISAPAGDWTPIVQPVATLS
jgi:hypothetical protein